MDGTGDKGEVEDITEADIISTVEFDHTGDYLATGDKGGRVVLFERNEVRRRPLDSLCEKVKLTLGFARTVREEGLRVQVLHRVPVARARVRLPQVARDRGEDQQDTMVQTAEPGALFTLHQRCAPFLPLAAPSSRSSGRLTSARPIGGSADKTIKLWKVFEKSLKIVAENNMLSHSFQPLPPAPSSPSSTTGLPPSSPSRPPPSANSSSSPPPPTTLKLPRMAFHDNITAAVPRKVYANAHAYHINSISINSDGETYMSADDLRINLWNLGISEQSFSASPALPLQQPHPAVWC